MSDGVEDNDRERLLTNTSCASANSYGSVRDHHHHHNEVSADPGDSVALLFEPRCHTVYREFNRRWYILVVYWLLSFIQATLWNTWSPISSSAETAYGLTDGDVSLMENWNNITYTIFIFPFIWLVERRGLRVPMLATASLMVGGAFVRCLLYWDADVSRVVINIGQFLIGIAGPVAFFCCTAISAAWFPPTQRTWATALMSVAQSGGLAFSFIIGPILVQFLAKDNPQDPETLRYAIQRLLYGEFVASALILVLVIIYFPSRPPLPPCESAAQERLAFWQSIKTMCSSMNALMIFTVYAISAGFFSGWYSLLALAVRNAPMGEIEAGWLGCWMTIGGIGMSLLAGFLGDRYPKFMKLQIMLLLIASTTCFTWFTLTCNHVGSIDYNSISAWVTCIAGGSFAAATQPLCYELSNEAVFPAPEASVTGFLTGLNNFLTMLYVFVQLSPSVGTDWLNWSLTVAFWICLPFIFIFRPVYKRLEMDNQQIYGNSSEAAINVTGDDTESAPTTLPPIA